MVADRREFDVIREEEEGDSKRRRNEKPFLFRFDFDLPTLEVGGISNFSHMWLEVFTGWFGFTARFGFGVTKTNPIHFGWVRSGNQLLITNRIQNQASVVVHLVNLHVWLRVDVPQIGVFIIEPNRKLSQN